MLVARSTSPLAAFSDNPRVEEYVPPGVPVRVTLAMPALEQYGDAAYTIVAVGAVVMVIVVVAMTAGHPAAAAMVYVTV